MHYKDNTEDFDLFIKGSLQDAEEKPSPRVWQGIASRLDAAAAPVAASFRWGWAVVAAAAAVAAVLVIPNNSNLSTISGERGVLAQASVVEPGRIPSPSALEALPVRDRTAALPVAADAGVSAAAKSAAQASPSVAEAVSGASSSNSQGSGISAPAPVADPFAAMAYEDSRKASGRHQRPSYYLGVSMGGNESPSHGAAYGAKSTNPAYIENVIQEKSASNYGIPFSIGAGVRFNLGKGFSAAIGADYTYLSRSFNGVYNTGEQLIDGRISQEMRYAGIPVGIYYNLISRGNVKFYLMGVGEAEWCLGNSYNIRTTGATVSEKVSGTQFSAGGGFGVDFTLTKHLSLYVDPTVRYYFDCGQPSNIRSENPLMISFSAGVRLNLF